MERQDNETTASERTERKNGIPPGVRRIPYPEATDEQLVLAALLGDLPAFDELIRRYRTAVIVTAQPIVGSRAEAEDVAQEVFLLAFKALPQLDEPSRFGWWLRAIARRRAGRHAEKERRTEPAEMTRLDTLLSANLTSLRQADPARAFADKSETEILWQAIGRLSPEHREVLILRGREGSVEQMAAFLDLSEPAVRGRLFRARAALRTVLADLETQQPIGETHDNARRTKRRPAASRRNPAGTETAAPDVPIGRTFQPDRFADRRRARCGGEV
jgi:RNA polymerase sigma-70 factor, ECF subfamily